MSTSNRFHWVMWLAVVTAMIGCGREMPEGYAPVRLQWGGGASPDLMNSLVVLPEPIAEDIFCPMDRLVITVNGPGISAPIHHRIGGDIPPKVNLSAFARAASGEAFQGIITRFLVPKGPDRRFLVTGLFHGSDVTSAAAPACEGAVAYPVFGVTSLVNVDQPLGIGIRAWTHGEGFRIQAATSTTFLDIKDTPFVALTVAWLLELTGSAKVHVSEVETGAVLTPPGGEFISLFGSLSAVRMAPLWPGRRYRIVLENSGNVYKFEHETGLLQEQKVSFTLGDVL